jgi:hypothetical protein
MSCLVLLLLSRNSSLQNLLVKTMSITNNQVRYDMFTICEKKL